MSSSKDQIEGTEIIQEMIYCPSKQTLCFLWEEEKKNQISFSQQIVEYILSNVHYLCLCSTFTFSDAVA